MFTGALWDDCPYFDTERDGNDLYDAERHPAAQ